MDTGCWCEHRCRRWQTTSTVIPQVSEALSILCWMLKQWLLLYHCGISLCHLPNRRHPNLSCMLAPMSLDSAWLNIVSSGAHCLRNTLPVFKARQWDYIAAHISQSSSFEFILVFFVVWSRLVVVEISLECRASHTQFLCSIYFSYCRLSTVSFRI